MISTTLVNIPSWGNASLLEAIWTLIGIGVVVVTAWSMPEVLKDLVSAGRASARRNPQDAYAIERIAWGYVRREVIRNAKGFIILIVGIIADVTPNPQPVQTTITGLAVTIGLFMIGILIAVQSLADRHQRAIVARLLDVDLKNDQG